MPRKKVDPTTERVVKALFNVERKQYTVAAHYILGDRCLFHLATSVGQYLISTVGELWSERPSRVLYAKVHDAAWYDAHVTLKDAAFDKAYMQRFGFESVGYNRLYETMVFRLTGYCLCGCGRPEHNSKELDFAPYNDRKAATTGHERLVRKWEKQALKDLEKKQGK